MFEGIFASIKYGEYLKHAKATHTRAVDIEKAECIKCGFCCLQRPCIPTPKEFEEIAKFLDITPSEALKKFFVIDALETGGTKFVFPAKESQLDITGHYVPWRRTYDEGYCIFFDKTEKKCKIWIVRPNTARVMECWSNSDEKVARDEALKAWENFNFSELTRC